MKTGRPDSALKYSIANFSHSSTALGGTHLVFTLVWKIKFLSVKFFLRASQVKVMLYDLYFMDLNNWHSYE